MAAARPAVHAIALRPIHGGAALLALLVLPRRSCCSCLDRWLVDKLHGPSYPKTVGLLQRGHAAGRGLADGTDVDRGGCACRRGGRSWLGRCRRADPADSRRSRPAGRTGARWTCCESPRRRARASRHRSRSRSSGALAGPIPAGEDVIPTSRERTRARRQRPPGREHPRQHAAGRNPRHVAEEVVAVARPVQIHAVAALGDDANRDRQIAHGVAEQVAQPHDDCRSAVGREQRDALDLDRGIWPDHAQPDLGRAQTRAVPAAAEPPPARVVAQPAGRGSAARS